MAKAGQMDAVKIMAKDLVRTRKYVKKFMLMRANIQAVSLKIQTLKSQNSMAQAMKGVTKAMMSMKRSLMPLLLRFWTNWDSSYLTNLLECRLLLELLEWGPRVARFQLLLKLMQMQTSRPGWRT